MSSRNRRNRAKRLRGSQVLSDARRVDLHLHSERSDGVLTPMEIVRHCAGAGLDIISITDHDLAPSVPAGELLVEGRRIWHIHGAEMSVSFRGEELHFLCYFPGTMPDEFREYCRERAQVRAHRYDEMVGKLNTPHVSLAEPSAHAGERSLTRLHLARDLHSLGVVPSVQAAFKTLLLGLTSSELFPKAEELITIARQHGAFVSWAHPPIPQAERWLTLLAAAGLQGLEAYRQSRNRKYTRRIIELAQAHNLCVTGGSDTHHANPGRYSFPAEKIAPWAKEMGFHPFVQQSQPHMTGAPNGHYQALL